MSTTLPVLIPDAGLIPGTGGDREPVEELVEGEEEGFPVLCRGACRDDGIAHGTITERVSLPSLQ
jgi:hypothetical protein